MNNVDFVCLMLLQNPSKHPTFTSRKGSKKLDFRQISPTFALIKVQKAFTSRGSELKEIIILTS